MPRRSLQNLHAHLTDKYLPEQETAQAYYGN